MKIVTIMMLWVMVSGIADLKAFQPPLACPGLVARANGQPVPKMEIIPDFEPELWALLTKEEQQMAIAGYEKTADTNHFTLTLSAVLKDVRDTGGGKRLDDDSKVAAALKGHAADLYYSLRHRLLSKPMVRGENSNSVTREFVREFLNTQNRFVVEAKGKIYSGHFVEMRENPADAENPILVFYSETDPSQRYREIPLKDFANTMAIQVDLRGGDLSPAKIAQVASGYAGIKQHRNAVAVAQRVTELRSKPGATNLIQFKLIGSDVEHSGIFRGVTDKNNMRLVRRGQPFASDVYLGHIDIDSITFSPATP